MKMFFATALTLLFVFQATAQTIIPKFGVTLSSITIDTENPNSFHQGDKQNRIGLTAGVGVLFTLSEKISFQPELVFIQKGVKSGYTDNQQNYRYDRDITVTYNYLELPLLVRYNFGKGNIQPFLVGGLTTSLMLGGNVMLDIKSRDKDEPAASYDLSYEFDVEFREPNFEETYLYEFVNNRFDLGAQIGGGVLLFNRVIIDFRFGLGMLKIYSDNNPPEIQDATNRTLQFSVGVPFKVGR